MQKIKWESKIVGERVKREASFSGVRSSIKHKIMTSLKSD